MNGVIVIVAYRPKPGKETELLKLVHSRVPTLCKEALVTDRAPIIMRARDGTIIEVSEWKSQEAIEAAHKNPNVLAMWQKFFAICDCVPFRTIAERKKCSRISSRSDCALQVEQSGNLLIRQGERNDRVFRAMIGPK